MRYLKRFNEDLTTRLRPNTDIIQTIKDILLPISDMGYENMSVIEHNVEVLDKSTIELVTRVVTYLDDSIYLTDVFKDEFIRLNDYLESEGFSVDVYYVTMKNYHSNNQQSKKEFAEFIKIPGHTEIINLLFNAKKEIN